MTLGERSRTGCAAVTVIALVLAAGACSGGADPEPTPESEDNGFTRAAIDFIEAVASGDAERYRLLLPPEQRPPADRIRDALDSVDLVGCDASDAQFRMTEGNGGIYVDVTFPKPCGDFGVTDACNLYYRRSGGEWWVWQWSCSTNIPTRS
jgi:hypothetical protein